MSGFPVPLALWAPTEKDVRAALVARKRNFNVTVSAASTGQQANFNTGGADIPADQVFIVLGATAFCSSGAAQTVTRVELRVGDLNGTTLTTVATREGSDNGVGAVQAVFSLSVPSLWLPVFSDETFYAVGTFNAGAAANSCTLSGFGVYMPRGTWQR